MKTWGKLDSDEISIEINSQHVKFIQMLPIFYHLTQFISLKSNLTFQEIVRILRHSLFVWIHTIWIIEKLLLLGKNSIKVPPLNLSSLYEIVLKHVN